MAASETLPIEFGRKTLAALARAAQAGGRFDEMYGFAKRMVTAARAQLSAEELDLVAAALAGVVESGQRTWRALVADGPPREQEVAAYVQMLRAELEGHALTWQTQVAALLASHPPPDHAVLFQRLAGDQYAALAELAPDRRDAYAGKAAAAYDQALRTAVDKLAPTHPLRLGVVLNYAVCEYELLAKHEQAIARAKRAFDEAIGKLDRLDAASAKVVTPLVQALRDQLILWTSDPPLAASD